MRKSLFPPDEGENTSKRWPTFVLRLLVGSVAGAVVGVVGWLFSSDGRWFYAVPILTAWLVLLTDDIPRSWFARNRKDGA